MSEENQTSEGNDPQSGGGEGSGEPVREPNPDVLVETPMVVMGALIKTWKEKWTQMTKLGEISFFKEKYGKLLKKFSIKGLKLRQVPEKEKGKKYCLNLIGRIGKTKRNFFFHANNDADYQKWYVALLDVLATQRGEEIYKGNVALQSIVFDVLTEVGNQRKLLKCFIDDQAGKDALTNNTMKKNFNHYEKVKETHLALLERITRVNWECQANFNETVPELAKFAILKNKFGELVYDQLLRSVVNGINEMIAADDSHRRLILSQCQERIVKFEFNDQDEFLVAIVKSGMLVISMKRGSTDLQARTLQVHQVANAFMNPEGIKLDMVLTILGMGEKLKNENLVKLNMATKSNLDSKWEIELEYPKLAMEYQFLGKNYRKVPELVLGNHIKWFIQGLELLLARDVSDFIKNRLLRMCPKKTITFQFDDNQEKDDMIKFVDGVAVISSKKNPKWLVSKQLDFTNQDMLMDILTDPSQDLEINVELDVQKSMSVHSDKCANLLGEITGDKEWKFEVDWMKVSNEYKLPLKIKKQLCQIIVGKHMYSFCMGLSEVHKKEKGEFVKNALLTNCPSKTIAFEFTKDKIPNSVYGHVANGKIVLQAVPSEDEKNEEWVTNTKLLAKESTALEILNVDTPGVDTLIIQFHKKLSEELLNAQLNELKEITGEEWTFDCDWQKTYDDLKSAKMRVKTYGVTLIGYVKQVVKRLNEIRVDVENLCKFMELFNKKTISLQFITGECDFKYCGAVNKGDGILYVEVKYWKVNLNDLGSRKNSFLDMIQ